jgi:YD repeat-containing protein
MSSVTAREGTTTYGYDSNSQLTSVVLLAGHTIQYAYDPAGNRTSGTDSGVRTVYATNDLNQFIQRLGLL